LYCDVDPFARELARERLVHLVDAHPTAFEPGAWAGAFSTLPQDLTHVCEADVQRICAPANRILADAGLGGPCQARSRAGLGAGTHSAEHGVFLALVRVLRWAQVHSAGTALFVCENVPVDASDAPSDVSADECVVRQALGPPTIVFDAAQVNSFAHRRRSYWTNMIDAALANQLLSAVERMPGLRADSVLDAGRTLSLCMKPDLSNFFYPCNVVGEPLSALPTLVSYTCSAAFTGDGPGVVYTRDGRTDEPSAVECMRAMGMTPPPAGSGRC
jgi:hypothetical protein